MSIITRCPECRASFKVVPDQIKISDGWARCGRCQTVFDALANQVFQASQPSALSVPSAPTPTPAPVQPPISAPIPAAFAAPPAAAARPAAPAVPPAGSSSAEDFSPSAFLPQDVQHSSASLSAGDIFHRRPAPALPEDDFADSLQQALESSFGSSHSLPPTAQKTADKSARTDWNAQDEAEWEHLDALDEAGGKAATPADTAHKAPSFVRRAERAARWQRPWVRALLWLLVLLLALALAGQWAWRQRDYLAVAHPQTKPWLEQACAVLGCKLAAWHHIDAVKVESSGFNKVREQEFRVNIHLRNAAAWPVATPSVLLSLSNADGQTVLRRVFSPAELGLPSSTLAAGEPYMGNALVDVLDNELSNAIVDYQMLVFYP